MKLVKKVLLACCIGSIYFPLHADAQGIPHGWKTECVGYFQISVPGHVEIGVVRDNPDPSKGNHNFRSRANNFYAESIYLGEVRTSTMLSKSSFLRIKKEKTKEVEELTRKLKTDQSIKILSHEVNDSSIYTLFESKNRTFGSMFIYQAGRIFAYEQGGSKTKTTDEYIKNNFANFSENFRPRALYEVPQEKGFCMPYGFVRDDSPQKRSMGTIMRLKDHPDVRILFRDASAIFEDNYPHKENASVEMELRAFWERPDWDGVNYQALGFRKFPSVQMGGYKGQSTFVEITRPTRSSKELCSWGDEYFSKVEKKEAGCLPQTKDYGYIAYVKGDPDAKEDTPDLLLYVMQDSQNAPDGKPTIGKDELRKMADTIAASIKRR
ncbi:T6SS immunity protein Tli4 family protein [Pseudomonas sp.]|uniref:T6SS immunity protein Tli4 family protein n=1 Tax=Pseudomonas sp. TaxID=306 RepID=UPI0026267088|nr:T6SS immunity protein Tli4 family protein [Pseudomonas sp.]